MEASILHINFFLLWWNEGCTMHYLGGFKSEILSARQQPKMIIWMSWSVIQCKLGRLSISEDNSDHNAMFLQTETRIKLESTTRLSKCKYIGTTEIDRNHHRWEVARFSEVEIGDHRVLGTAGWSPALTNPTKVVTASTSIALYPLVANETESNKNNKELYVLPWLIIIRSFTYTIGVTFTYWVLSETFVLSNI